MSFLLEHDGHVALALLRATFDVVLLVDAALQVVAVEGDPSPLFGDTAAALCGASLRELFPHVELAVVQHRIRAGGGTWRFGASSDRVLARGAARGPVPVEGLIQRLPGPPPRAAIALRDARASARFHDAHGRALRDQRVLRVVHRALTDEGDEPTVLAEVCRALVGEAGYPFTWIGFREHDPDRTLRPVAHAGSSPIFSAGPPVSWADDERGRGPAGTAARTGVTTVVDQILAHPAAEPWRGYFQQRGIGSVLGLPIRVDGEVVGALSFHAREPAAFPPHEVELLEEVADAVGRALTSRRAITARRRAEDRMAEVLDALGVATWTVSDVEQRVTWVSDAAPRLFGFPRSSLLTMPNLLAVVHPEDCAHVESLYADLLREGHVEFEVRPLRAPERWVHAIIRLIRGEAGRVLGREGVAFDVTERRRAEEALRSLNTDLEGRVAERTAALHDLYDNAPCGYYTSDVARRLLGANATLLRWLGYAREEVVGRPVFDFLSPESAAALRAELAHAPEGPPTGVWHDVERELVRRDGSTFWVQADGAVRRDAEGRVVEVRATLSDITLRRQAEARLREQEARLQEALREAQQAARAKDDFLASMSHELRTPLNGVLGLGEALLEGVYGPMSAPQRTALTRARESGEHLLSLINDILDVAKVESGKLALELAPVQLDELVRESLQLVQESARRKGINVELGLSAGDEPLLLDARRLRQVLVNLLSNAVKFTPEGGLVGLEVEESASTLAITVWDRGLGIAAEDLPRLFQPFVQLDSRLSRAHTGTGLGLTLVRRLVALHGGEVSVESELGRGSRFTIELPVRRPALDAPATPTKTPSLAVRRLEGHGAGPLVLVAEDDETNATLVRDVLAAAGYRVERARDGAQAVEMARSLRPDAILMDVQMPVMDGLGATRAIRADDDPALRAVPILAVTALAMPGDEARCRSAGADAYLTKPVGHKRLLEALEAHLPGAGASGSSPPTAPTTR